MELLTRKEVETLTGLGRQDFESYIEKYNSYFPVTVTPNMARNGLFPKGNLSFLLMMVELARTDEYTDEQLKSICERVARSRRKKKQMVAVDKAPRYKVEDIVTRLDMILYGNNVLKKGSDSLRRDNRELKEKNRKMQKTLERILAERKSLARILREKEDLNIKLNSKITHLASTVLRLKRENQDLKQCVNAMEERQEEKEKSPQKEIMASLEQKLAEFERKHSNLVSQLATATTSRDRVYSKAGQEGLFSRFTRFFKKQSFENKYSL